jgi:hypothetical protein
MICAFVANILATNAQMLIRNKIINRFNRIYSIPQSGLKLTFIAHLD